MSSRRRPPSSQLALPDMAPAPSLPAASGSNLRLPERTDSLERRVTRLEAEVALLAGQLERDDDDD